VAPPGDAAIIMRPIARYVGKFITIASKKAIIGRTINWLPNPTKIPFGSVPTLLKSLKESVIPIPNIMRKRSPGNRRVEMN
jgi:hypothetical protein